jgi:ribosomal-protein-alanine N-acetyltransferase
MKIEREHASERLAYRALCPKDVSLVFHLHSFPEVAKYNTIGLPKNETETTKILSKRLDTSDKLNMGWIIYNHANQFVGEVGFVLAPKRFHKAEISYSLLPSFWNNGYATEVVTHFIRFAFNDLQLHRLEAGVAINNKASIRVLEKCGMKREGHHRKILPLADGWSDSFSYAILKEEIGND